jgi:hypothetical protein
VGRNNRYPDSLPGKSISPVVVVFVVIVSFCSPVDEFVGRLVVVVSVESTTLLFQRESSELFDFVTVKKKFFF